MFVAQAHAEKLTRVLRSSTKGSMNTMDTMSFPKHERANVHKHGNLENHKEERVPKSSLLPSVKRNGPSQSASGTKTSYSSSGCVREKLKNSIPIPSEHSLHLVLRHGWLSPQLFSQKLPKAWHTQCSITRVIEGHSCLIFSK